MIGVNSIPSSGRMRSRSLCSVRSGRDSKETDPFRYPRTPRSRSLKPLAFPDLLGKTQDGQQHRQSRKKKVEDYFSDKPAGGAETQQKQPLQDRKRIISVMEKTPKNCNSIDLLSLKIKIK